MPDVEEKIRKRKNRKGTRETINSPIRGIPIKWIRKTPTERTRARSTRIAIV
jgi:hypothetical protein